MAGCTVPKLFGLKRWWESKFHDLCLEHDRRYMLREGSKTGADLAMAAGMAERGHPVLALVALLFCLSPYAWYLWIRD